VVDRRRHLGSRRRHLRTRTKEYISNQKVECATHYKWRHKYPPP